MVRLLDAEMPIGREYAAKSGPNLCIAETDLMVAARWSDEDNAWQRMNQTGRAVPGHPEGFSPNISVPADQRLVVHTNPWGLDPFHPRIDDLVKYALKGKEGRYAGFQTHSATKWEQWAPAWLDKASPLVGFTDEFTRVYPHLCAADAFVPVGKVCTRSETVKSPRETDRLRRILDDATRLNYIPALRVNYRECGLDDDTVDYLKSLGGASWK